MRIRERVGLCLSGPVSGMSEVVGRGGELRLGGGVKTNCEKLPKNCGKITSQRLLDQSQAGVYMGKTPHTPPFWPF